MNSNKTPWAINLNEENVVGAKEHLSKVSACRRRVFTTDEDKYLTELVTSKSYTNWFEIAKFLPGRSPRQCRDRWVNYLSPENSFEPWTEAEDQLIVSKVNEIGTKWSAISKLIPGRSDNSVKNRWYSGLKSMCSRSTIDGHYIYDPKQTSERKSHPSSRSDKHHNHNISGSVINCGKKPQQQKQQQQIQQEVPMIMQPPMIPMFSPLMFSQTQQQQQTLNTMFQYQYAAMQSMMMAQRGPSVPIAVSECPSFSIQPPNLATVNNSMSYRTSMATQPMSIPSTFSQQCMTSSQPMLPQMFPIQSFAENVTTSLDDSEDEMDGYANEQQQQQQQPQQQHYTSNKGTNEENIFDEEEQGNIWDRQIENQLNEMDQDPFATPEIFNEWF